MTVVLIVDDSSIDRRLAAGLLGHAGDWTIQVAQDGGEALAIVAEQPPDIIVTDLQMPEVNGLELMTAVRNKFPQIPVILMTAQGSEEIAMEALRLGAASYVPKRILARELLPTVRRVLSQASEDRSQSALMHRLQHRRESYRVETDLSLMMALSKHLQQQLGEAWQLEKSARLRIGTALEEALLNAYYHGNLEVSSRLKEDDFALFYTTAEQRLQQSPYKERTVEVELILSSVTAAIIVRDEGPGFDPGTLPDPRDIENLDRPCGRGVMLMRSFMDDVQYNAAGNEVTLTKRRFAEIATTPAS
ncbi:response regulator [bacterium]|nr:response regulator [bacterium]